MEFFHSYNRGVEKRNIFLDGADYARGVHDLYEFNDANVVINLKQRFNGNPTPIIFDGKVRERLVNLGAWCFMPNHYHIFSQPVVENGLSKYQQKFGVGLTNFFNIRYNRNGVLFQGKYKKILVDNDNHALQLICYIHANPLDLWKPNWKEKGLIDFEIKGALKFLESYRWSSHLDWWGTKNFSSLISIDFMRRFFENSEEYKRFFMDWLKYYRKNTDSIKKLILDK